MNIIFHFRRKTRWELTRISAAVMGIEFAYAAETAFVSPTLLKIGKDDEVSFIFKLKTSFPEKDRVFTLLEFQDKIRYLNS